MVTVARSLSFKIADGIVCPNVECRAIWDVVSEEGRSATFRQRQQAYACHQCKETNYVDSQRLKPGLLIRCDCGARAEVALAIMAVEDDKSETPAAP